MAAMRAALRRATPALAASGSNGPTWSFYNASGVVHKRSIHGSIYTLWSFNSLPWYRWPIEIDGLPWFTVLKQGGSFQGYVE